MSEPKSFDTKKKPSKPKPYLMPIEWGATSFYSRIAGGSDIERINCKGLKSPFLLLCNHGSFIDFPLAVKAIFPHRTSWVISIEEFIGREWLMRGVGGIYKRKFTADLTVVRHILNALTRQKVCCTIYPEARFSLAGINEQIDGALGKLAKKAKVPVCVFIAQGNFIRSPQWNKHPYRNVPIKGTFKQIVTREEVLNLSAEEIQKRIEASFVYDDYAYIRDNKIPMKCEKRAQNIHKILYQCPACGKEFSTDSKDTKIWCSACGAIWEMDDYGVLHRENGPDIFTHVPDWYRWERENVRKEVLSGSYRFEDTARLERLVNGKVGFTSLGQVKLVHDYNGFTMTGKILDGNFSFNRSVGSMRSVHIEYDFKGRGDAIDLCTLEDTYFVFPLTARNVLTKLHFATEELHILEEKKRAEQTARIDG